MCINYLLPALRIICEYPFVKGGNFVNPDEITAFKGTAVKAFREYAGKGATIKHISMAEITRVP